MSKENRVSDERLAEMLASAKHDVENQTSERYKAEAEEQVAILTELQSLRSKPVAGVEVKPLGDWRRGYCDERVQIQQQSFGGLYQVRVLDGVVWLDWPNRTAEEFATVEQAKAAAEADYRQRILSTLSLPAQEPGEARALYSHQKRGTVYELIGIGKMQAENWEEREYTATDEPIAGASVDMREVAVYRSVDNPNEIWVRPRGEFEDGRFAALTAALKEA